MCVIISEGDVVGLYDMLHIDIVHTQPAPFHRPVGPREFCCTAGALIRRIRIRKQKAPRDAEEDILRRNLG